MEWIFSEVFKDAMAEGASQCAKIALHNLLVCYRKLIAISTIPLTDESVMPNSPLGKLLGTVSPRGIITTNQDLLVENLLYSEPSLGSIDLGTGRTAAVGIYGGKPILSPYEIPKNMHFRDEVSSMTSARVELSTQQVLGRKGATPLGKMREPYQVLKRMYGLAMSLESIDAEGKRPKFCADGFVKRAPKVLKLHGSLNWWYESQDLNDPTPLGTPDQVYFCCERNVRENERLVWMSQKTDKLYPFVVPPVPDKGRYFRKLLKPVWKHASAQMAGCECLIAYGYGFPETDSEAIGLFKEALNPRIKDVYLINTDDALKEKVEKIVNDASTRHAQVTQFRDVEAFLEDWNRRSA